MANPDIRDAVKERYGAAARAVSKASAASCCGGNAALPEPTDPITGNLYDPEQKREIPVEALAASLGCGNPTALAELKPGEVVLDLGSGGGIDVLLSARRVGPSGKAYGLDMTEDMLALARANQAKAGVSNAEFLQGTIEDIPLPDASVDVLISNCVINLSGDKERVLREAFRVLKPGGRFAVSDIVLRRPLPDAVQKSVAAWTGCVAGALLEFDYRAKLAAAGFADIGVEPTRVYTKADAADLLQASASSSCCGGEQSGSDALRAVDGSVMSAFIRARKP